MCDLCPSVHLVQVGRTRRTKHTCVDVLAVVCLWGLTPALRGRSEHNKLSV